MEMNGNDIFTIEPDQASFEEHSEDGLAWLHFMESHQTPPRYLMLTLSHDDKQSYVELNDQAFSSYDCLAEITFFRSGVVIQLKPEAAGSLQHVSRIALNFKRLPTELVTKVQHLLATTFAEAMQPIPTFSEE